MGAFVRGDLIVIPFPFTDLSSSKKRPALIIATLTGKNVILCQITSQHRTGSKYSVEIQTSDVKPFQDAGLVTVSYAQTDILFTADSDKIIRKIGNLSDMKMKEITTKLIEIIEGKL